MIRFLIVFLALCNIAFAEDIKGNITYTEQTARIAAFTDLARKVPKEMFKNYVKDKYYKENYENLKKGNYYITTEPTRSINPFYVWNNLVLYSVEYDDDINKKYYYNSIGRLVKFEINDYSASYPYRAIAYDRKGEVINITFVVSEKESFIFDKNEKLFGHWLDNQFYNKNGKKSFKRILE